MDVFFYLLAEPIAVLKTLDKLLVEISDCLTIRKQMIGLKEKGCDDKYFSEEGCFSHFLKIIL